MFYEILLSISIFEVVGSNFAMKSLMLAMIV